MHKDGRGGSLKRRSYQFIEREVRGGVEVAGAVYTPNSTTGYLRTIIGPCGLVSLADFTREYYGEHCLEPRHVRDWLNWSVRPNADSAWAIGEAAHRAGVRHASGLLTLLAASRLVDFAATIIGLDPEIVFQKGDEIEVLLKCGLSAVRGTLLDNTYLRYSVKLGGDADISEALRDPHCESIWRETAPYIDIEREIENHRRRADARVAWTLSSDMLAAAQESFKRWRRAKSAPYIRYKHAACALAVAQETRMDARDREDMVIDSLLRWLRESRSAESLRGNRPADAKYRTVRRLLSFDASRVIRDAQS
jgi:hypothetical protein